MTLVNARTGSKMQPAKLQLGEGRDGEVWLTMTALGDGRVAIRVGDESLQLDEASFRELASWVVTVALQQDPLSRSK
ncbi:hypothetical protein [Hyphomicrobium sp. ghe19]|uniref:hypothetical protein n=1 Tax=Hyphomicrobium sp. ghe19 TaxID=2682968 RepID=UPI0013675BC8|nr:hypothetical protein HYPP_03787 [Hyphomicrobium sp. ghe19]